MPNAVDITGGEPGTAVAAGPGAAQPDHVSAWRESWGVFGRNRRAVGGLAVFAAIVVLSIAGPMMYGVDPFAIAGSPMLRPGEEGFLLGTDYLGRDMLAGILQGGRASLLVGFSAALITMSIGVGLGALAGFHGGWVDSLLMRVTEFFQVLPPLLFAMTLVVLFSPTLPLVALAIGLVSWPSVARLARGEFLKIRQREFVKAARTIGSTNTRVIWRVIFPNALPPLIVAATLTIGIAVLFEGGLSYLGLGDANVMSWGMIMGQNRNYMLGAWWTSAIPGFAIFVTVLSVSLVGDGLSDVSNPRLRER
jgi:peptide/nickel transport system permease protein